MLALDLCLPYLFGGRPCCLATCMHQQFLIAYAKDNVYFEGYAVIESNSGLCFGGYCVARLERRGYVKRVHEDGEAHRP